MCSAGYPEPYAFSRRVYERLRDRRARVRPRPRQPVPRLRAARLPARRLAVRATRCTTRSPSTATSSSTHATSPRRRATLRRWYGFLGMQMQVARQLPRHLTVSENSRKDIVAQMGVDPDTLHIVPVGVDQTQFRPMPHVARVPGRLMTTASADVPLKGLPYLHRGARPRSAPNGPTRTSSSSASPGTRARSPRRSSGSA